MADGDVVEFRFNVRSEHVEFMVNGCRQAWRREFMNESLEPTAPICVRCGRSVEASRADYDVFEKMHYTCFHYEFEHGGDPDVECSAGGCPAAGLSMMPLPFRIEGVDLTEAGNTVVPAILAFVPWASPIQMPRFVSFDAC